MHVITPQESSMIGQCRMLGLPIRWQILQILKEAGDAGLTHGEISDKLGRSLGAWPQLKRLVEAELIVKTVIDSRDVRYTLNLSGIQALLRNIEGSLVS